MTTVGYGDKAPKSIGGRIFSIIWILAGIVIFCIMSGEVTRIIMEASAPETRSMAGESVGVLSTRLYDRSLVARGGGNITTHTQMDDEFEEPIDNKKTNRGIPAAAKAKNKAPAPV